MSSNPERVNWIIGRLSEGTPSADIIQELEVRKMRGEEIFQRGVESEKSVARAIKQLSFVRSVKISKRHSREDKNKKDISVLLCDFQDEYGDIGNVFIQVKSSNKGVMSFETTMQINLDLGSREEVQRHLLSKKMFVINGSMSEEDILDSFCDQFASMLSLRADQEFST